MPSLHLCLKIKELELYAKGLEGLDCLLIKSTCSYRRPMFSSQHTVLLAIHNSNSRGYHAPF